MQFRLKDTPDLFPAYGSVVDRLAPQDDEMPTSIPIIRATTSSAEVTPCTSACVAESSEALTGAIASPMPTPASTSGTEAHGLRNDSSPH